MDLRDRVALVTGVKRIGAVVSRELAAKGASVALAYNTSKSEAEEAVRAIREKGGRAAAFQADVTKAEACDELVARTVTELGRLDVLINMASLYRSKPFDELSERDWDANLAVDLKAAFLCARAAVPHMRAAGGGRIISISDWLARSGRPRYPGFLTYYVAKTGVIGLTEALALELAPANILVNAIAPGPILAPPGTTEDESAAVEKATPLGRWGGEGEIAKAVLFLIDTDFVTGEIIRVDGGRHLK